MLRKLFPFSATTRALLVILIGGLIGWNVKVWLEPERAPRPVSDEYASRDPDMRVLTRLGIGALSNEARLAAISPASAAGGWDARGGASILPPPVELIGLDQGYAYRPGFRGHVIRLPPPASFGQALNAMEWLAHSHSCGFAIDYPEVPNIDQAAPEIEVMQIIWTRSELGEEPRRCRR